MKLLSSSLRLARIRGVEIRFHFSVLFSIPIAFFLFNPNSGREVIASILWLIGLILSIFLHEVGHALAAQLMGVEVKSIVIWLLGGFTNLSYPARKPAQNLVLFSAGPLVNMLLGFFLVFTYVFLLFGVLPFERNPEIYMWGQTLVNLCFSLALANVILVIFNLLPIYPLDGGNMMRSVMEMLFGRSNADLITLVVSAPLLLGLAAFAIVARDYLLLASCVLIGLAVGTLNRSFLRRFNLGINYLFKRSGYYYLQGDYDRAIQEYARDIEREPGQVNHYLGRAACYLNVFQKERAIADVERALKLNPNHVIALQLRGEIFSTEKNYDAALDFFARAQTINPHWAVPYFDRGSALLDQKEFHAALAELDKAISLPPPFPLFHVLRSLNHFILGDLEAAHKDQDVAMRLSPSDALVMSELNLQIYEGYLNWADDYYGRILTRDPLHAQALQGYADACRTNLEHIRAVELYTRAIAVNPREARLYLGRGKSHLALGDLEKAQADFEQVLAVGAKLHLKRQAGELLKN
ncbi:Putative zinc metalloprotease Rip3 [Anaerolineales bacterium]|nr:Putative zinc metalloprotease Rip3 [Anaerolineales bacterium]